MHTETPDIPVLIVGAGPAGLTAAGALARLGVQTLIVERRPELSSLPRATSVSTRSMELFRSWGLEDEVRAGGVDVEWQLWTCRTLAESAGGMAIPIGLPTREQSSMISPSSPACVPQDHLEPVLLRHLLTQGGRAELGVETIGVEAVRDGLIATLRDVATQSVRRVRARYVIGADGAHSRVRTALGIAMHGPDRLAEAGSAPCSGRRCGSCSATAVTASTTSPFLRRRASCCPPGRVAGGCMAPSGSPAGSMTPAASGRAMS